MPNRTIPPLPEEQGGSSIGARLCTIYPHENEEPVREWFRERFGREPDCIHSPESSDAEFWWVGWVTKQEAAEVDAERKARSREKQRTWIMRR